MQEGLSILANSIDFEKLFLTTYCVTLILQHRFLYLNYRKSTTNHFVQAIEKVAGFTRESFYIKEFWKYCEIQKGAATLSIVNQRKATLL